MPLVYKIASTAAEFEAIHDLNYRTFVEEIPQHQANPSGVLVDRFDRDNTYVIAVDNRQVLGMAPSNTLLSVRRISNGSTQLLVGPAASFESEQMKVRSSTRATSLASLRARKQPGHKSWFSRMKVPRSTISEHSASYSACEPSTQWIAAGLHSFTIFSTQRRR